MTSPLSPSQSSDLPIVRNTNRDCDDTRPPTQRAAARRVSTRRRSRPRLRGPTLVCLRARLPRLAISPPRLSRRAVVHRLRFADSGRRSLRMGGLRRPRRLGRGGAPSRRLGRPPRATDQALLASPRPSLARHGSARLSSAIDSPRTPSSSAPARSPDRRSARVVSARNRKVWREQLVDCGAVCGAASAVRPSRRDG